MKIQNILFYGGIIVCIAIRLLFFNFRSADYDVFLVKWMKFISENGIFHAFKYNFSNYPPLYLHLLSIGVLLHLSPLYYVKFISTVFDFITAYFIYRIVMLKHIEIAIPQGERINQTVNDNISHGALKHKLNSNENNARGAFVLFLLLPTVILNSACWGQCDSIYTGLAVASLYFLLCNRNLLSFIMLGLAFCFKLQTIFLLPVFILVFTKRKINKFYWLLLPCMYFISIIPSLIAGRNLLDLSLIYYNQTYIHELNFNIPNFYSMVPFAKFHFQLWKWIGLGCALMLMLFVVLFSYLRERKFTMDAIIYLSLLTALTTPYFLPAMHDRYYYMADVFSFLYFVWFRKNILLPVIICAASFVTYLNFLFDVRNIHYFYISAAVLCCVIFLLLNYIKRSYERAV